MIAQPPIKILKFPWPDPWERFLRPGSCLRNHHRVGGLGAITPSPRSSTSGLVAPCSKYKVIVPILTWLKWRCHLKEYSDQVADYSNQYRPRNGHLKASKWGAFLFTHRPWHQISSSPSLCWLTQPISREAIAWRWALVRQQRLLGTGPSWPGVGDYEPWSWLHVPPWATQVSLEGVMADL